MTPRPVRFIPYALVAAVAWLASGHAPTTAQAPPAGGDTEKRLQSVEDKLDKLIMSLKPREARVASSAAHILADAAERLRADLAAQERLLAELRAKNPFPAFRVGQDGSNVYTERLARTEAKRSEYRLERAELEEKIAKLEAEAKAALLDAGADKKLNALKLAREQRDGLDTMLRTLEDLFVKDQTAARGLAAFVEKEKAFRAEIARDRRAIEAVAAALRDLDKPAK